MKTLGLAFVGLLTAKAIAGLRSEDPSGDSRLWRWSRGVLYGAALVLVILGARSLGFDAAAEVYASASGKNLEHAQLDKAYNNALRAVQHAPVSRPWIDALATGQDLRRFERSGTGVGS